MDIILYNIFVPLVCLIIGYFFGSIPFSIIIGKFFFHQDPRDFGSKNAGGSNAGRLWGKKFGVIVICLDMIKTIIPIYLCWAILTYVKFGNQTLIATTDIYYTSDANNFVIQWPVYYISIIGVALGHCFPLFSKFRGGKCVSVFVGSAAASSWLLGLLPIVCFFFPFLKKTKYVSLSSICTGLFEIVVIWVWVILVSCNLIPFGWQWFPMYGCSLNPTWHYALIETIVVALMIIRHSSNIKRLINKTERKITWM